MSTHIVDRIVAIKFPKDTTGHYADQFLVAELGGDNNVTDNRGRRARTWSATAIGQEWEIIGQACQFAAGCSGGMVKLRGRVTKPESYIRAYRKAIAEAKSLTESELRIVARIQFIGSTDNYAYKELAKFKTPRIEKLWGDNATIFDFALPSELATWLQHRKQPAWHCAEVSGPGEV
jgi:hypothetical protein